MRMATSEHFTRLRGAAAPHRLRSLLEQGVRPAVGFISPMDVLKDPHLTTTEKREILSSWASDASAVEDEPTLRWLIGTPEPVLLDEVRDALARLDGRPPDGRWRRAAASGSGA